MLVEKRLVNITPSKEKVRGKVASDASSEPGSIHFKKPHGTQWVLWWIGVPIIVSTVETLLLW